jgi:hypothetical protein
MKRATASDFMEFVLQVAREKVPPVARLFEHEGRVVIVEGAGGGVSVKWSHLDENHVPAYTRDRSFLEHWRRDRLA